MKKYKKVMKSKSGVFLMLILIRHTWPQSLSIPFTSTKAVLGHQDYSIYVYVFNVLCIYAVILTRNGRYLSLVWIFNSHPPLVNFTYGSTDVYDILHSLAFPAHCGRSSFSIHDN